MSNTPAPRPELLALLDAVKDHPDDDTPRLVLADWLDEQDNALDAERAAFIRKDIARMPEWQVRSRTREESEEADALAPRWLGPVAEFVTQTGFHRGLPTVWVAGARFAWPRAPELLASEEFAFVQHVRLTDTGGPRLEAMAALPAFRHVPGISLSPFSAVGSASAHLFFCSPNLTGLRQIEFRSVQPGVAGLQALATNPTLSRLRRLHLAHNKLADKGVVALAAAKHLANLETLFLDDNNLSDASAESLAASGAFPNLRVLNLRDNPRLTDRGKQALRDAFGDRVRLN